VLSIVGFVVVRGSLSLMGNAPRADAVVRVVADHDGVVLGRPSIGVVVRVVADHDGVVPGCPGIGAVVRVATDHDGVVPGCPNEGTTIADMVLDVADDGTLEDPTER